MTVTKPPRCQVWPCETPGWCSPVTWDTWHLARQTFTLARHEPSVPASCHGHMVTIPVPVSSHMMAPLIRSHSRNHVVRTSSSAPLCKRLDSKLYLCDGESRMIIRALRGWGGKKLWLFPHILRSEKGQRSQIYFFWFFSFMIWWKFLNLLYSLIWRNLIFVILDPFLTLGYLEMIKGFLHPINAVPYFTVWAAHKNFTVLVIFISIF